MQKKREKEEEEIKKDFALYRTQIHTFAWKTVVFSCRAQKTDVSYAFFPHNNLRTHRSCQLVYSSFLFPFLCLPLSVSSSVFLYFSIHRLPFCPSHTHTPRELLDVVASELLIMTE